jgi:hypothetical protein
LFKAGAEVDGRLLVIAHESHRGAFDTLNEAPIALFGMEVGVAIMHNGHGRGIVPPASLTDEESSHWCRKASKETNDFSAIII